MTANAFKLLRNSFARLVLIDSHGRLHENVTPVRAFPFSAPQSGISLVGQEGEELAWINDLDQIPEESAVLILDELSKREFVPEIRRISNVSGFACPSTWQVETDRGATTLVLKGEEDIRRLSGDTLLISDTHGIEYMIKELSAMDQTSRKILDRFL